MNMYIIGGLLATLFLVTMLDKGRILKDLFMVLTLLILSLWAVIIYGIISPMVLAASWAVGPLLRFTGVWPSTGCIGSVWTNTLMHLIPRFGGKPSDTEAG